MRILLFSNSVQCPSGYGTQANLWGQKLPELGHEVAVAAFHGIQGAPLTLNGVLNYPGSTEDPFSQDVLPGHYGNWRADLLITLMDAWALDAAKLTGMNIAHWMPVDCTPLSHMDRRILDMAGGQPIAMSRFGQRVLAGAGYDAPYVPHGIDCEAFRPLDPAGREKLRGQLGFTERFVIGINAANQDPVRKGLAEQFAAFAALRKRHPEALLLVHSRVLTRQGADLNALASDLGIREHVQFGDQYSIAAGAVSQSDMARWYGLCDLVSNCSYGEGFGLAAIEAQACGTPIVTTDFSAMAELCGAGWKVGGERFWNRGHSAWWLRPSVRGITGAYEKALANAATMREQAREFALAYDAGRVLHEYWKPALDGLEASL